MLEETDAIDQRGTIFRAFASMLGLLRRIDPPMIQHGAGELGIRKTFVWRKYDFVKKEHRHDCGKQSIAVQVTCLVSNPIRDPYRIKIPSTAWHRHERREKWPKEGKTSGNCPLKAATIKTWDKSRLGEGCGIVNANSLSGPRRNH